jgi:hypothetical protein
MKLQNALIDHLEEHPVPAGKADLQLSSVCFSLREMLATATGTIRGIT